jgi:hypothetical protein
MNKIKLGLGYLSYPFTMADFFIRALRRRNDVELFVFGPHYGQYTPWNGGMNIPMKYPNIIDLPLPPQMISPSWEMIKGQLPNDLDAVICVDAGFHISTKPDIPYAVVGTDPHVLGDWYAKVRHMTDKFFNMQSDYMQEGDILLPYAMDPTVHYPVDGIQEEYDCCIIGLHYPQRDEWVKRLRALGVKVNYRIGDIYDEYREENNKAWIGLNWSSLNDVTARVFEICAMKLVPVFNRLPALDALGFEEGRHYLGFSSMDEAVDKVMWAKNNREFAEAIALNAYQLVHEKDFTWDNRIDQILTIMGLA